MQFIRAAAESILLYGAESWTLTKTHESQLNAMYMGMLHFALNVHWSQHVTNEHLYGDLPYLSTMIRLNCMKFVGHCCQAEKEPIFKVLFWMPPHGRRKCGRPALSYPKLLENEMRMMAGEIQNVMRDKDLWLQHVCERLEQRLDK